MRHDYRFKLGESLMPRLCRLCGLELVNFYYVTCDPRDAFYVCECQAVNPIRRPPGKLKPDHTNEWTKQQGDVSIKDMTLRDHHGGYHIEKRTSRIEVEIFPREREEVVALI